MPVPFDQPITVTRPYLPPLEKYRSGLAEIWDNAWVTNNGPLVRRFTAALRRQFGTEHVSLMVNGTQALLAGLEVLGIRGDVITTPFTFAATTHALLRCGAHPVFADIDPDTFNLDPAAVEAAITPATRAILAVHVFGRPCDHAALQAIARRHGLRLVYDAAHAFGVTVEGRPLVLDGDMSMVSLHATKVFHAIEGGVLICQDQATTERLDAFRDFGFSGACDVSEIGTNAKMNEFQALMGLQVLEHVDELIKRRRLVDAAYREHLAELPGLTLSAPPAPGIRHNFAYFPVLIDPERAGLTRDELLDGLRRYNVFARAYFHPVIPDLRAYQHLPCTHPLPVARRIAAQVLALPLHSELTPEVATRIAELVRALMTSPENGKLHGRRTGEVVPSARG